MPENGFVDVTVKVPKRLMQLLEERAYFGWSPDDFFTSCVTRGVGCELNELDIDELQQIKAEFGPDIDTVSFDLVKRLRP